MSCFLSHSTELSFYFSARRERVAAGGGALPRHCRQDLPFFPQNSGFPHLVVPGPELLNHGSRTPGAVCSSDGKSLFLKLLAQAGCFFPSCCCVVWNLWCRKSLDSQCQPRVGLGCSASVSWTVTLLPRVPPGHPVVLRMPSLSPVIPGVGAEAAFLLQSMVLMFSITSGHLSCGICPKTGQT